MLSIKKLQTEVEGKEILKGINLEIADNTIHVLMGRNGSGKSTLAQTIAGNPSYMTTGGKVLFNGKDILNLSPEDRSKLGIFLCFQYPSEISGVSVFSFLRLIYNNSHENKLSPVKFRELAKEKAKILNIDESMLSRSLNEGFSGGEKKRMEMLQMLILEPKLAILDEVDSGLDIDALKIVAGAVNFLKEKTKMSVLIITHYARILKYLEPDFVHVVKNGNVVRSGGKSLAHEIEEKGYKADE